MTTLVVKDTSGTFTAQAGEAEELRTRAAKRFRLPDLPDGRQQFRVGAQVGPVHCQSDPFAGGDLLALTAGDGGLGTTRDSFHDLCYFMEDSQWRR